MVVGVDRRLAAALAGQDLVGAAGDHLVGVHVRLGARPGLPDDQRELAVEVAARDLARRLLDRLGELRRRGRRCRAFTRAAACLTKPSAWTISTGICSRGPNGKLLDRALGLRAPISVGREPRSGRSCRFRCGCRAGHGLPSVIPLNAGSASFCGALLEGRQTLDQVRGDGVGRYFFRVKSTLTTFEPSSAGSPRLGRVILGLLMLLGRLLGAHWPGSSGEIDRRIDGTR